MLTEQDVDDALHWLQANAAKAAQARAEKIYLEEYSKSLKSLIMKEYHNHQLSIAAQEREALSDARYIEHLEGLREAVRRDAEMTFRRASAEAHIQAWQTWSANLRGKL